MTKSPNTQDAKPWTLAVRAVIHDDRGRVLLLRRSKVCKHFVGCWEWPGGKVDPGEDFATAVKREAREETSLDVELTGVAGVVHFGAPAAHFVTLCLEARVLGGKLRLSKEHDESKWVGTADFHKLPLADQVKDFMLEYSRREGLRK